MFFGLNPTHLVEKEMIYNFFMVNHYQMRCAQISFVFRRYAYSPYTQRAIFLKITKKLIRPVFNPPFDCWKYCPLKKPGIVESENSFLRILHTFFRIRRIR